MADDIASGATYLAYQYGDADKLRVRYETHRRYSVKPDTVHALVIAQCRLTAGLKVLDAGCGPGTYHAPLVARGATVVAFDFTRGMTEQARASAHANGIAIEVAQASVEAIPFADALFDRVMANHMLYHVPDIPRALRELRRVARPGGRVVLATNGAIQSRLSELHRKATGDCGYTPIRSVNARFTLDDLPLVQSVFPGATVVRQENELAFPDADAVLRYYASYAVDHVEERAEDGSHRAPLLERVRTLAEEIITREGELREPKVAGCFVADV